MLETCCRLRRLCRKRSNNVARHDKTPVKSTLSSRDMSFMSFMSRRSDINDVVAFIHLEVAVHALSENSLKTKNFQEELKKFQYFIFYMTIFWCRPVYYKTLIL